MTERWATVLHAEHGTLDSESPSSQPRKMPTSTLATSTLATTIDQLKASLPTYPLALSNSHAIIYQTDPSVNYLVPFAVARPWPSSSGNRAVLGTPI